MSDQAWQWLLVTLGATAGVIARVGKWRTPEGAFDKVKAVGEIATIPALAALAAGAISYWWPDMGPMPMVAISTFAGLVGVGAVEQAGLKFLHRKIDE